MRDFVGCAITATGWTLRELYESDWIDVNEYLFGYWQDNPPIHLVGKYAWFTAKDGEDSQSAKPDPEANASAQAMLAGSISDGNGGRKLSALPAGVQRGIMSAIGAK